MNLFRIAQKVVCINAHYNSYCACPLTEEKIYTVYGFYTCNCGSEQIYLDEVPDVVLMGCACHKIGERRHSYYISRFRGLQYFGIYNKLLENKNELGEKTDIPELVPEEVHIN